MGGLLGIFIHRKRNEMKGGNLIKAMCGVGERREFYGRGQIFETKKSERVAFCRRKRIKKAKLSFILMTGNIDLAGQLVDREREPLRFLDFTDRKRKNENCSGVVDNTSAREASFCLDLNSRKSIRVPPFLFLFFFFCLYCETLSWV